MKTNNNYLVTGTDINDVTVMKQEFYAHNINEAIDKQIIFAADYQVMVISRKDMYGNWVSAAEIYNDGSYTIY